MDVVVYTKYNSTCVYCVHVYMCILCTCTCVHVHVYLCIYMVSIYSCTNDNWVPVYIGMYT